MSATLTVSQNMAEFQCWLNDRLTDLKTDVDLFSTYIRGILEGDDDPDEKHEYLQGILECATKEADDVDKIATEIISMFNKFSVNGDPTELMPSSETVINEPQKNSFDEKVRTIFSQQTAKAMESAQKREVLDSEDSAKLKSCILSKYSEVEVAAEADDVGADAIKTSTDQIITPELGVKEKRNGPPQEKDPLLVRNTNAEQVLEAEKLKRERNKQESEAKKAKDKQNRENQKKKDIDRKEKEKQRTQKGERKR